MSTSNNRTEYSPFVSSLIDSFVPDHVRANYPDVIAFIAAYLDYLETSNLSGYYQNTLPQQRDIEPQDEQFLRRIEQEIGLFVPREYEATPRLFYNKISELWRSKGSAEAVKTFFQLFLNDTVQVRFPWDFVLKPSDGRWQAPEKIRVSIISGNGEDLASQRIQQLEEYGFTTVNRVERKVYADQTIFELSLVTGETIGTFRPGNRITNEDGSVVAEIYNSTSNIIVTNPGQGYEVGDRIRLVGRSRISFEGRVTAVNETGGITATTLLDFGSGTTPQHIRDVRGSGRYFLDEFGIFQYLPDNRELDLGDNLDISEDSVEAFTQDYVDNLFYFAGSYVGDLKFSETDSSIVTNPLQTDFIITTPADPTSPLEFKVDTLDGTGAEFSLEFGAIVEERGYYEDSRGQLSDSIVLQDSEFYQKFSYEVVTEYSLNDWIDPLKKHVSPSGTKPFGLINKIELVDPSLSIRSNGVREISPNHSALANEFVAKSFTKRLGDCAACVDDTTLLSKEEISFIKRVDESAFAVGSGVIHIQDYTSEHYFSADYTSKNTGFE
jgi:hypothetical protein